MISFKSIALKRGLLVFMLLALFCQNACYTFVGSSLSPEVKSISVSNFNNYSALFNPNLSQQFTLALTDRFDQRTNLNITTEEGDISVSGEIIDYRISPTNIGVNASGGEVANQNQLTIKVKVNYKNRVNPEKAWERSFTDQEPFDANQTLQSVETSLVEVINERLINQIFNAIVIDW